LRTTGASIVEDAERVHRLVLIERSSLLDLLSVQVFRLV
jgi:hypothetical protein